MSYFYKFGYGTCEESEHVELVHEKKFTKKEIENIFIDAYEWSLNNMEPAEAQWTMYRTFQRRFSGAVEYLKTQGFTEIKYQQEISLFGWASCFPGDSWKGYTDATDRRFQNELSVRVSESPKSSA